MKNVLLLTLSALLLNACGGSSSTKTPTKPASIAGTENFQVVSGALVAKAADSVKIRYGIDAEEIGHILSKENVEFVSLEGDINLLEDQITGDARSRVSLEIGAKSQSVNEASFVSLLFDNRSSGTKSRAYLNTSAGEFPIAGVHKLALTKGTAVHYKIEALNDGNNFVQVTIGDATAMIAITDLVASDMKFTSGAFKVGVKNPQAGDFAKASIDNIVLHYTEAGVAKTATQNFDGYDDGRLPVEDEIFNAVDDGSTQ